MTEPTQDVILGKTHNNQSHDQIIVRNNMAFTIHNSRVVGSQPIVWLKVPPNRDPIQYYENALAQQVQTNSPGRLVRVEEWINDLELAARVYVAQKKLPAFLDYEKSFRNSLRLNRRRSRLRRQEGSSPSTSSARGFYGGGSLSESACQSNSGEERSPTQNHDESNDKIVQAKGDSWNASRVTTSPIIIDDDTELNGTPVSGSQDEDTKTEQNEPKNNHNIPVNNKQIKCTSDSQQFAQDCAGIIIIDENADKADDKHESEMDPNPIIARPSSANNKEVDSEETEMETIESDGIESLSSDSRVERELYADGVESLMENVFTSTPRSTTTKQSEETELSNRHLDLSDEGDQTKRFEQDSRNNCIENLDEYSREETESLLKKGIRERFVLLNKSETSQTELSPYSVSEESKSDIKSDGEIIRIDDSEDEDEDSTSGLIYAQL